MYKLYVPLVMLLSREVLPIFLLSISISFMLSILWEGFLVTPIVWEQRGVTVGIRGIGCRIMIN
jgi:D-alanyl-lipoteichoic acid acyltransferase DltB (MBOAT superfamily)